MNDLSTRTTPREYTSGPVEVVTAGDALTRIPVEIGPWAGNAWDLRRAVVLDADDPFTIHSDSRTILATPYASDAPLRAADVAEYQTAPGVPAPFTFSRGTVIMRPGEYVVAWVFAADGDHRLVLSVQVEEWKDERWT